MSRKRPNIITDFRDSVRARNLKFGVMVTFKMFILAMNGFKKVRILKK